MAAGEHITYQPNLFPCIHQKGNCSPAISFNLFFTKQKWMEKTNEGCGGENTRFPNSVNQAEVSVNFGISDFKNNPGEITELCPNADSADISAVTGVNATINLDLTGYFWPSPHLSVSNGRLGTNANRMGVFGWAATNCINDSGYENPTDTCAAPIDAPQTISQYCLTPNKIQYNPITFSQNNYCPEISDMDHNNCNIQRAANQTGGQLKIKFQGFLPPIKGH